MKKEIALLRMKYKDGELHFFNHIQISDMLFCDENVQIITSTRETFCFPLSLNHREVEKFLGENLPLPDT